MDSSLFVMGLESVSDVVLNLVSAIVIVLVGLIAGSLIYRLMRKVLHEFEIDDVLKKAGINLPIEKFLASLSRYVVYFIAVIWALSELGLATTILHIILLVILAILVIFIILAFKDFIPNLTAGFFIHQKELIKVGDKVKIGAVQGKVLKVDLIDTRIKTKDGDIVLMPNSLITKSQIIKKS